MDFERFKEWALEDISSRLPKDYDDAAVMINYVQDRGGLGTYIGIGTETTGPVHNPKFDFDEECLPAAAELLARMLRR